MSPHPDQPNAFSLRSPQTAANSGRLSETAINLKLPSDETFILQTNRVTGNVFPSGEVVTS